MSYNLQILECVARYEDEAVKTINRENIPYLVEAKEFYSCYARLVGFSVTGGTSTLDGHMELIGKYFLY